MQSKATTVAAYVASLPPDRRAAIEAIRKVVNANLDADCEEGMGYGMITWYVPHRIFPDGYHCNPEQPLPYAGLASQKHYISLYLCVVYCGFGKDHTEETPDAKWFRAAWTRTGRKLDMGKVCIRFKRIEDVPLEVVAEAIRRVPTRTFIERYLRVRDALGKRPAGRKTAATRVSSRGRGRP